MFSSETYLLLYQEMIEGKKQSKVTQSSIESTHWGFYNGISRWTFLLYYVNMVFLS